MPQIITYPGSIPQAAHPLLIQRDAEIERGYLAQLVFGTSTVVDGLACTPAPAGIGVVIDRGVICQLGVIDPTGIGVSLPADGRALMKIGVNPDATPFGLAVPATPGQAQNFVIEAKWSSLDTTPVVLPYVNTANPAQPFSGPGGTGAAQNTLRNQFVDLQLLVGAPGVVGSQPTPGIDSGWVGLWIITARAGATSILQSDISVYPGAPFVSNKLQSVVSPASLAAETAARIAADANLQAELDAEVAARIAADNAETAARVASDNSLGSSIGAVNDARVAAEANLYAGLAAIRSLSNMVTLNDSQNWVVPAGIHRGKAMAIGGGGGGGSAGASVSGGGGGAAGSSIGYFSCTPGQVFSVIVGAGGAGGSNGNDGGPGSSTSFGSILSASGGAGGQGGNTGTAGGAGGQGYGGDLTVVGGFGGDGTPSGLTRGGDGGSGPLGGGGRAATVFGSPENGAAYGSGAGGGYDSPYVSGGYGQHGAVIIEY